MPPKKGKKGKKLADDDIWNDAEVSIPGLDGLKDEEYEPSQQASRFSPFAVLDEEDRKEFDGEDMDGGLMGTIQANLRKKNKNNKIPQLPNDISEPAPPAVEPPKDDDDDGGEEDAAPTRLLSKKEKEKLKKDREKAKKKAQAESKKAESAPPEFPSSAPNVVTPDPTASASVSPAPPAPTPAPIPAPASLSVPEPNGEDDDDDEAGPGEGTGKSDKKKKKKKKPAAKEEVKKEPPKKKIPAGVAALKALMEQQKAAEEEARRREEEERRRIEEEERRLEEEARLKEEVKQRRKEKEKAKKELAKKEGRLLTDKQKREKAQAEIQRKALIASGVRIEGLEQSSNAPSGTTKKVVYGNKKKKPSQKTEPSSDPTPTSQHLHVETSEPPAARSIALAVPSEEPRTETAPDIDVKDDWDASSDDEVPPPPPPSIKTVPVPPVQPIKQDVTGDQEDDSSDSDSESDPGSGSGSESSSDDSSEGDGMTAVQKQAAMRKAEAADRRLKRHEEALAARSKDDLRSPICCILGHVDTGKTKLLDKIRQTNVQEGEAGGITQQIGATYFPVEAIQEKTKVVNATGDQEYKIPGLLVIDTPGHESFTNLRSRGSSLCNIAVLVVDIMHGLEPQTLESLRLLRDRKTPFIVALNKIDRMYGWVATPDNAFRDSLAKQPPSVQREFAHRCEQTVLAFAEQGLNAALYYENKNMAKNVSLVPTSAVTGEGVPDMIMLLVNLTQQRMSDRLMYLAELECTVLEVKIIEGLGTTIDVVLSNGILREGDKIVLCGLNGPIVTQVRALLTPQPMRELRIKSAYVHHKEVKAALGVKITAPDLEKAIAGSRLMVVGPDDDEDDLRDEVMSDLTSLLSSVDRSGRGVTVQASTLGSLEALLDFLKSCKIPVAGIGLGPVYKRDILQAATMLEKAKELACILCFDVPVDKDAERLAEEWGIKLFKADIIYHLFDAFTAYNNEIAEAKRRDAAPQAIYPCRLKIIAAFAKRDPIILGVDILDGTLRTGTPLCVVKADPVTGKKQIIPLGKITSLEINHKSMEIVKKSQAGAGVAVKIEHAVYQSSKIYGRHFDDKDELFSQITRQSIDVMKGSFKDELSKEEWLLMRALKQKLDIQ